jgi:hypothetical protein
LQDAGLLPCPARVVVAFVEVELAVVEEEEEEVGALEVDLGVDALDGVGRLDDGATVVVGGSVGQTAVRFCGGRMCTSKSHCATCVLSVHRA